MTDRSGADRTPSERVDVCIVGAGVAGAIVGSELASRGYDVVFLEGGERFDPADRLEQMERAIRPEHGAAEVWNMGGPRDRYTTSGPMDGYSLNERRVKGVGGTTLHWLGSTPRLHEKDFEMRTRYGLAVDWPIGYDDLRPYYAAAESELGVAGSDSDSTPPREEPYPLEPFPPTHSDRLFERACDRLEISMRRCPQARNSSPYDDRSECQGYGTCSPVCPSGAKYSGDVHVRKAEEEGARVIDRVTVEKLEHDDAGSEVEAARYVTPDGTRHRQEARQFVLACGGVETPRLLLLSASSDHPDGLANSSGAVGRYFMEHPGTRVSGRLDRETNPEPIGFLTSTSEHFYDHDDAPPGSILLKFSNSGPASPVEAALTGAGSPGADDVWESVAGAKWGDAMLDGMDGSNRTVWVSANVEMLPRADNRVSLDRNRTDAFGNPVPHVSFGLGEYGIRTAERAIDVGERILEEVGATVAGRTDLENPIFLSHHMGTTRMGTDPDESVVDPRLRTHDVDNCWIVSSSVFPTCGAANPTLTIAALALRAGEHIDESL
ncbi:GMC family oxidoreductase [Natrialbaceae archaeon GCM10025810]|uniref:GMC family oxidoreductase n=1 Tax=Halovalidus salilacus TaxID=3075124 RepID=UPI0036174EFD